jgi:hypothetical protein
MQQHLKLGDSAWQTKSGARFGNFVAPRVLIGAAVFFGAVLLLSNVLRTTSRTTDSPPTAKSLKFLFCLAPHPAACALQEIPEQAHAYLSSLPLALAGIGYALLQISLRPARGLMLKRLLLAATFVGWAVDQVLPAGRAAVIIGDGVITAYVLDLYWIMQEQIGGAQVPARPSTSL